MPYRFVLFDAFSSLSRGNRLVRFDDSSVTQFLEGVPLVSIVAPRMIESGWIEPDWDLGKPYWRLTDYGWEIYQIGLEQYRGMKLHQKIFGRSVFCLG
jgi:hypothetical protein